MEAFWIWEWNERCNEHNMNAILAFGRDRATGWGGFMFHYVLIDDSARSHWDGIVTQEIPN